MTPFTEPGSFRFEAITYAYPGAKSPAIDAVDFAVDPGQLAVLVGPSGCGKSTLLRIAAGLLEPNRGRLLINGKDMVGRPAQQRNIGWVPQSYALFDHLSVADNIAFGLRMQGLSKPKQKGRVQNLLALCQISELAQRSVQELSGGQRQRVAIARALAVQPKVLLLDEPLAALDPQLRSSLRANLVELVRESGATTLFVTHDQGEALAIADHIAVLRAGRLEQYGSPETLWNHPVNSFVAQFLSNADVLEGRRIAIDTVELAAGLAAKVDPACFEDNLLTVALRPDNVEIDSAGIRVVVTGAEYTGGRYLIRAQVPDGPPLSFFSPQSLSVGTTAPIRLCPDTKLSVVGSRS